MIEVTHPEQALPQDDVRLAETAYLPLILYSPRADRLIRVGGLVFLIYPALALVLLADPSPLIPVVMAAVGTALIVFPEFGWPLYQRRQERRFGELPEQRQRQALLNSARVQDLLR